ncbi:hypothetical protein HK100_000972 [Physocladia obscura]|uniref:Uncharacterized protein n=1 Tax=Physocladia obscura TaxID=109957 RepID=A0AAD5SXH4_9FUNG|nr:hypothetical protein HK100_000972 [Physocladia obscura]
MFIVVIVVAVVAVIGAIAAVSARRRNSGDSGNNRKRHKRTKKISEDSQAGQAAGQMLSNRRFAVRASTASGEYLADSEYEDNADERSEENSGVGGVKMTGQLKHQNIASKRQRLENFGVHDFGASNQEEISDEDGGSDNYRHSFELAHESRRILVQRNFHEPPMAVVVRDNAHVVAVDTTPEFFNTAGSCAHISTS